MREYSNEKETIQSNMIAKQTRLDELERRKRSGEEPEELLNDSIEIEKKEIAKLQADLDKLT